MSIARRPFALIVAALLLVMLAGQARWLDPVRAEDPTLWDALAEQERMEEQLALQRAQLASLQRQQADLTATISALDAELQSVGMEVDVAVAALDRATRRLAAARSDLIRYKRQIENLAVDLSRVATGIRVATSELVQQEALLEEHLRLAYEQSQTSILEVLLSSESFSEAGSQLSYMLALSEEDRVMAQRIRTQRDALRVKRTTLRDGASTLDVLREAAARREAGLRRQEAELATARAALEEKQALLAELRAAQDAQLVSTADSAEEASLLIAQQERALEGQIALVAKLTEEAKALDIAYRGRFEWPERGDFLVTQEFGQTSFSSYHTGIDLSYHAPYCSGPIYAAGDGIVLADGRPNAAYGDYAVGVVLGHSQRLQTWYWHLSSELVSVGQSIHVGDLIGYEGATGFATGCHLHFQVMFDGAAVNPRLYLP